MNRTQYLRDALDAFGLDQPDRIFIDGPGSNFARKNDLVRYKLAFYMPDTTKMFLRETQLKEIAAELTKDYDNVGVNKAYVIESVSMQCFQDTYLSLIVWFKGRAREHKVVAPTTVQRDNVPSPVKEYKPVNAKLDKRTVQALVNNEDGAAEAVARFALESMAECAVDMWEDNKDCPAPDAVRVREMASDYVTDMLDDLKNEVERLVLKDLPFEFETKVEHKLVVTKKVIG